MGRLSQRSTVYFDPLIHQALKVRSVNRCFSLRAGRRCGSLTYERRSSRLSVLSERVHEPEVSYEEFLTDLINAGKVSKPIQ